MHKLLISNMDEAIHQNDFCSSCASMFSSSLLNTSGDYDTYKMFKVNIFNPQFLTTKSGRYKGYPFRSYSYGSYTGGYSDHFPVYMYLIKEKN